MYCAYGSSSLVRLYFPLVHFWGRRILLQRNSFLVYWLLRWYFVNIDRHLWLAFDIAAINIETYFSLLFFSIWGLELYLVTWDFRMVVTQVNFDFTSIHSIIHWVTFLIIKFLEFRLQISHCFVSCSSSHFTIYNHSRTVNFYSLFQL